MSWFNLWDGLKTKTCRYLLQRYLGQFFENNLNLEQLKIDLYNGKAVVENISLKVNALNDLFEEQGWAFEVVSGHIGCLTAMVPWNALMTNDSSLNISNLIITLRPIMRNRSGSTMFESMWSSVSSSMQMAEECMKQIDDDLPFLNHSHNMIGLEKFAETIDNVLNRIHAKLRDITVNIEYTLPKSLNKLIITFKANHIEYKNQTGYGNGSSSNGEIIHDNNQCGIQQNFTLLPMIAKHNLITTDLVIYTSEINYGKCHRLEGAYEKLCKIIEFKGCQQFYISVKQTENIIGPKINLEILIDDVYLMLSPRQIHLLAQILKGFEKACPKDLMPINCSNLTSDELFASSSTKTTGVMNKNDELYPRENVKRSEYNYDFKISKKYEAVLSSTLNSTTTSYSNQIKNNEIVEKSGEILKFKIQVFKIEGIILHNDILVESHTKEFESKSTFSSESFENYCKISNMFFQRNCISKNPDGYCLPILNNNFLLVMFSSLLINGDQQRLCHELTLKTMYSATKMDLSEIVDNISYPLILFDREKNCHEGYHTRPEIILAHNSSYLFKQNCNSSSNNIECTIDDCVIDFDITIVDRLGDLLEKSPFVEEDDVDILPENVNPIIMKYKCNSLKLQLRFPEIECNLIKKRDNLHPTYRNIRNDYFLFIFRNILIQLSSYAGIIIDEIDGYYCDNSNKMKVHVMNCVCQNINNSNSTDEKICVKVYNKNNLKKNVFENNSNQKTKSPFSSKCSYGYSSNIESFHDNSDKSDFILPGDTDEINEFCESCKDSSKIIILASIPKLKIVVESKTIFELIYNRLNGNLLMWEPKSVNVDDHNISSFDLSIKKGIITIHTEVQDSQNKNLRCDRGKLKFDLSDFRLFSVSAFGNNKNLSYFCIQLNEIYVYHCGQYFEDVSMAWLDVEDNLSLIFCNIPTEQRISNNRLEILSIVAEVKKQPEKHLKRIKLAFGINGINMWHIPTYTNHHWINQLTEFLDISDYPIDAYEPYAVVSEIQGHIWNCIIEYQPKYFGYKALLDVGCCSFCSNIIYPMTGCTLRLISEDCILSIGPIIRTTNDAKKSSYISRFGLVPLLNIGLLNFSIHLDEQNKSYPKLDLRSSIHDIHLKTCFDSAEALAQLIAYIASDKDLKTKDNSVFELKNTKDIVVKSIEQNNEETLLHINNLMADAVLDVNATDIVQVTSYTENFANIDFSHRNSYNMHNISDFESNIIYDSYFNESDSKSSTQVETDLGITASTYVPPLDEKDYHVIHDEDIFFMDKFGVEKIYVSEGPIQIVDNHFCLPNEKSDLLRPPIHFPIPEQSYTLCEMTFTWHLFGGRDFPEIKTKSSMESTSSSTGEGMSETYKYGVSQNSRNCQTKVNRNQNVVNNTRNLDILVEIQFTKLRFSYEAYPLTSTYSSRQVLVISDIEIRDRLISSEINKLFYHPNKKHLPPKFDENMVTIKALNVRSNDGENRSTECSLKISILPIRLNIDQDTLFFLEEFFSGFVKGSIDPSRYSTDNIEPNVDVPAMNVDKMANNMSNLKTEDTYKSSKETALKSCSENSSENEDNSIYFKEFIFSPALPICFDYHGRRVELSRGPITGVVLGLAQLQGSGICLREVINRRGILGWNKLFEFVCKEWLKDIKRNQLPNILSGIGPTNAVLQLFQGFFDLFRLPLQQYNKDGRIIRGFQLGAQSFSARTVFAALEITSRIINLLQFTAETTYDMLSTRASLHRKRKFKHGKKRQGPPKDLREGVVNAYTIVKNGINESANTLLEAAIVEHDQNGYSGAVGAVVRQIPQLVVCPAVLATQATTNILGGAKSSLVPEAKREASDKWKQTKN